MTEELETQVTESPGGEVVSPVIVETEATGVPTTPEEDEEISALQAAVDRATTDEEKEEAQKNHDRYYGRLRTRNKEAEAKNRDLEIQLAEERGRREMAERMGTKAPDTTTQVPAAQIPALQLPPRPTASLWTDEEGYEDQDKKTEALADWRAECKFIERDHKRQQEEAQKSQVQAIEAQRTWEQQGEAKYPGFVNKVNTRLLPILNRMPQADFAALAAFITKSPQSYEVITYLADNPAEAQRLTTLDPWTAMREVTALEGKLKKPEPKKTTEAPGPIVPLGGTDTTVEGLDAIKNDDEWYKQYRSQQMKARQGVL